LAGVGIDDSVGSLFAPLGRRLFDLTPPGLAPVAIMRPGVRRPASVQGNSRYESQLAGRSPS
jgi:hypothetical protein